MVTTFPWDKSIQFILFWTCIGYSRRFSRKDIIIKLLCILKMQIIIFKCTEHVLCDWILVHHRPRISNMHDEGGSCVTGENFRESFSEFATVLWFTSGSLLEKTVQLVNMLYVPAVPLYILYIIYCIIMYYHTILLCIIMYYND